MWPSIVYFYFLNVCHVHFTYRVLYGNYVYHYRVLICGFCSKYGVLYVLCARFVLNIECFMLAKFALIIFFM